MNATALERYSDYLQTLSQQRLSELEQFVTPDVRFKDPFNDCLGIANMRQVLSHMYETFEDVSFKVSTQAAGSENGFLAWHFTAGFRGKELAFDGVSHLVFADDELVSSHVDHWDAARAFYETLPVIGWPLTFLRRRIAVD